MIKYFVVLFLIPIFAQAQPFEFFPCVVTRVIDGDTIGCRSGDDELKIRFIGVEAFESKNNKRAKKQAQQFGITIDEVVERGQAAKKYLELILPYPTLVMIETDKTLTTFDRILGYIWKQSSMVNLQLLEAGYVYPNTYKNKKYKELFEKSGNH